MIEAQLLYILCVIGLAYLNYYAIWRNLRVYHALNGIVHLLLWAAAYLYTKEWIVFLILPLLGRAVFDASLNYFRGLGINYVSRYPKSIIDQLEFRLFAFNGVLPKLLWISIAIIINLIYYATHT